jgi:hypothetical protein
MYVQAFFVSETHTVLSVSAVVCVRVVICYPVPGEPHHRVELLSFPPESFGRPPV